MKIKVHSSEKESNGYAINAGGNTEAYDLWVAAKGARAHAGPYVAFASSAAAAEHGNPFPCYFCGATDGFAIYHQEALGE